MRLVDANHLLKKLQDEWNTLYYDDPDTANGLKVAYRYVITEATIDAVRVVRCKDCKYGIANGNEGIINCECSRGDPHYADYYCMYGERKDENSLMT